MKKAPKKNIYLIASAISLLLLFTACTKVTPTAEIPTTAPSPEVTPTSTVAPASLLIVDPNAAAGQGVLDSINAFAGSNGLMIQTAADLNGNLDGVKIAVVFGDIDTFKDTASANPLTQFLFIGSNSEGAAGNISLVVNRPQDLAFMAGYLASISAEDWRSGGLLASGALPIDQEADAFINGGKLVCGNCAPIYPPYNNPSYYPLYWDVTGKNSAAAMEADLADMKVRVVDVVFVSSTADLPEVLDRLEADGTTMIGDNVASPNASRYATILGYDSKTAVEMLLPKLLAGQGGQTAVSKVTISVVNNPDKISPGKQAQFAATAQELADDLIIPITVK